MTIVNAILAALSGTPFLKLTGSGNDFVFFDGREVPLQRVNSPEVIQAICSRHNGIGADGIVVLEPAGDTADVRIHYFNSDGTAADLCGNATLCSTALSALLGLSHASGMTLSTPAGIIASRLTEGVPEIDLQPVREFQTDIAIQRAANESRMGFAVAGIPHLVILCSDADAVDVAGRGPGLRHHAALGSAGANVNWVSPRTDGRWRYRTFERGVEGETLACGTGAVATAVLLREWGLATGPSTDIITSSGRVLTVSLNDEAGVRAAAYHPTLRGEGRVVFRGTIERISAAI